MEYRFDAGCGQPLSLLRQGGSGIRGTAVLGLWYPHVRFRTDALVDAGSAHGKVLFHRAVQLLCYYSIGQYNYCAGNPIRFSDKKGESIKDAVVGFVTGVASNLTGNSALRDSYTPDNSSHYNIGLGAGDVASVAAGAMLIDLGSQAVAGGIVIGGGATVASGGSAAGVAVPVGAAISGAGALAVGTGVALMSNTAKNASQGYNRGNGPKPNDGKGAPHGNPDHNAKIDDKIKSLRKGEATDIRKNQAQVDVNGNKVGNNRPDVQYNKDGVHHNCEVDRTKRNATHEEVIRKNDPNSIYEVEIIK